METNIIKQSDPGRGKDHSEVLERLREILPHKPKAPHLVREFQDCAAHVAAFITSRSTEEALDNAKDLAKAIKEKRRDWKGWQIQYTPALEKEVRG